MTDQRLIDLLLRHEELQEAGQSITLEELCKDCPELVEEVRRRLAKLKDFEPLATPHDGSATFVPGAASARKPPTIPGYEIVGILGEGGMGIVFQARHIALNRLVALKVITAKHASPDDVARFQREVEITARLEHPGVVPVYSLIEDSDGLPCYAMRLIEGESLQEAINRFHAADHSARESGVRRLALRQLLGHFLDVCNTIAYAHSRGVIHRDLKPANVMLGKYGEVVVVDWGLGKAVGRGPADTTQSGSTMRLKVAPQGPETTVPGETIGTPAFMSPEQAQGLDVKQGSDIFSLGATLYYLLTNRAPFTGVNSHEVVKNVQASRFPPPRDVNADVPRALEAICLRAMARQLEERYGTVGALANDIEKWLADEPISAYREPLSQKVLRWGRQRRTLVTSMLVSIFVALIGLAAGVYLWQQAEQEKLGVELERRKAIALADEQSRAALDKLKFTTQANEKLVRAQLDAGDFEGAERFLIAAIDVVKNEPAMAEARSRLTAQRDRVHRIVEFYKHSYDAERTVVEANPHPDQKATLASLTKAMSAMRVHDHEKWWENLPDEGLLPAQRDQLKRDVYREMILFAAIQGQPGLLKPGTAEAKQGYLDCLKTIAMLNRYQPSQSASLLEAYCYFNLGELGKLRPLAVREPTNAADFHFVGMLHIWIAMEPGDSISRIFKAVDVLFNTGLDARTPQATAERYLITAVTMEPTHYWSNYWLGTAYMLGGKHQAAEAVFSACVALRPHYSVGNGMRALVIDQQRNQTTDPVEKKRLAERGLTGLNEAIRGNPGVAWPFALRGIAYNRLQDYERALVDLDKALALEPNAAWILQEKANATFQRGQFAESHLVTQRFLKRLAPNHHLLPGAERHLQKCVEHMALDRKLQEILAGNDAPKPVAKRLEVAELSRQYKRYHATAAKLYAGIFDANPELADDLARLRRYRAACSAVLASCGKTEEPTPPSAAERDKLRTQALAWLRTDLEQISACLKEGGSSNLNLALDNLHRWQTDPDLAGVRDPKSLAALSAEDRKAWQELWKTANQLLVKTRANVTETTISGTLSNKDREQIHELKVQAGNTYFIEMRSTFDTFLKLQDASGKLLAENDDIGPDNLNSRLMHIPKEDATHRIIATSYQQQGRGSYTLTIRTINGKSK
jgi:serine/threonine protein kinase